MNHYPVGYGAYIDAREGHINRTMELHGLRSAWSDFFAYLGEAMVAARDQRLPVPFKQRSRRGG